MRPVFHYRPWRIQAHVTIAMLALLVERIAEIRTGNTWRNLADQLDRIKVVEYEHNAYPLHEQRSSRMKQAVAA
jgi:transposase